MQLDGAVVSATFDDVMDMGIVGTTAGTLWYVNWAENTSIRLINGHKSRVGISPGETFIVMAVMMIMVGVVMMTDLHTLTLTRTLSGVHIKIHLASVSQKHRC